MEAIETARIDGEWTRCRKCGSKLGRIVHSSDDNNSCFMIEIKCHSCKTINYISNTQIRTDK